MRNVTGTVANKRQLFWFPQTRYSYLCTDFIRMIRNRRLLAVIDISHRQPKEANVYETLPYKGCALRTCVQDNANEDTGSRGDTGRKQTRPDNISWLTRYCINTAFLLHPKLSLLLRHHYLSVIPPVVHSAIADVVYVHKGWCCTKLRTG